MISLPRAKDILIESDDLQNRNDNRGCFHGGPWVGLDIISNGHGSQSKEDLDNLGYLFLYFKTSLYNIDVRWTKFQK